MSRIPQLKRKYQDFRDGKAGYLNDLPLVWQYTRDVGLRYPETAPLIQLLERVLAERDIRLALA